MQKTAKSFKNAPIRIAVVEDHKIVRQGLAEMLAKNERIEVIIEAENGQEFLDLLANKPIDIVLLDFEMPLLNGRSTLEILQRDYPSVRSIMLSMYEDPWIVSTFIGEGANGFLKKNCSYNELIEALIDVFEKGSHHNELVTASLLKRVVNKTNKEQNASTLFLSEREKSILTQICIGKTSEEIADIMFLSKKTIDLNRSDLMKRFGASNSANLVNKCMLLGLYTPRTDEEVKKFEIELKNEQAALRKKK
jgi:two-component system response regulator DegU